MAIAQIICHIRIIKLVPEIPFHTNIVVVYGGGPDDRISAGFRKAQKIGSKYPLISPWENTAIKREEEECNGKIDA